MRFDDFIRRCRAEWPDFGDPARLAESRAPSDRALAPLLHRIPGIAVENKLKLLNLAAASLDNGEVYVEIGAHRGLSLVAAAHGNASRRIFACDNFHQSKPALKQIAALLALLTPPGQVEFHELDWSAFLKLGPWRPAPIGAFFCDGHHSFAAHYDALRLLRPHLADDALVIVDDTNYRAIRAANLLFARETPGLELILDLRTPWEHHPSWWNGIQVFRFLRAGAALSAAEDAAPPPRFAFTAQKIVYDDILARLERGRLALRHRIRQSTRRLFR
jgi:protein O-GlcNAc transferase